MYLTYAVIRQVSASYSTSAYLLHLATYDPYRYPADYLHYLAENAVIKSTNPIVEFYTAVYLHYCCLPS